MNTTIFLAQFWGWFSIIIAVIYLIKGKSFLNELLKIHEDKNFVFLSGWMLMSMGLATIILHNVWVADWRVIITANGWASFFMGIIRIGFPEITQKLITVIFKNKITYFRIVVTIVGLLGVWLISMSL